MQMYRRSKPFWLDCVFDKFWEIVPTIMPPMALIIKKNGYAHMNIGIMAVGESAFLQTFCMLITGPMCSAHAGCF